MQFGCHVRIALVQFRDGEFSGAYVRLFQDQMNRLREVEEYDKLLNGVTMQVCIDSLDFFFCKIDF